jgi:hypothetical protein
VAWGQGKPWIMGGRTNCRRRRRQICYVPRRTNDPSASRRVRAAQSAHSVRPRCARAERRSHSGFDGSSTCDCCNSPRRFICLRSPGRPIRWLSEPSSRIPPAGPTDETHDPYRHARQQRRAPRQGLREARDRAQNAHPDRHRRLQHRP